jgi:hypothetical protein
MEIISNRLAAEKLSAQCLVLELQPVLVTENKHTDTFCIIPDDKITKDQALLERYKQLHNKFVQANKDKNGSICVDLADSLIGQWGGELDEFYISICQRYIHSR